MCVVSYVVVVHEFSAVSSQSTGEKLSRFNGRRGQFRTTLKEDTIVFTSIFADLKDIRSRPAS